jgi:hypothetical protein
MEFFAGARKLVGTGSDGSFKYCSPSRVVTNGKQERVYHARLVDLELAIV